MITAIDSLKYFIPELWLIAGAFIILGLDLALENKKILAPATFLFLIIAFIFGYPAPKETLGLFSGFFYMDGFSHFFRMIAIGVVAITVLLSMSYVPLKKAYEGEFYALMLFMAFALDLIGASKNLLMIFLSIEFVSILSYLLVGYDKTDHRSKEAAVKYLLFGSVASGMMLYGLSLLFGISGGIELADVQKAFAAGPNLAVAFTSCLLILTGIGFKISMAPFHLWAPDVYEGAPTPVTAFLTVGPKALGFAVLIRVLVFAFPSLEFLWVKIIVILAIATMTIGNVIAISQTNIKRLLAYSSIAQAGYILMGIAVFSKLGMSAVLYYLLAYAFTNLGAFAVTLAVTNDHGSNDLEAFKGLSKRSPGLALAMTVFLLSLAGIPPLAGFIGKFYVFAGALENGFYLLAIAAAINSAIAVFYYFKIVRMMYLVESEKDSAVPKAVSLSAALLFLFAGTVILGIFPVPFIRMVAAAFSL